MAGFPMCPHHL